MTRTPLTRAEKIAKHRCTAEICQATSNVDQLRCSCPGCGRVAYYHKACALGLPRCPACALEWPFFALMYPNRYMTAGWIKTVPGE